MPNSFNTPLLKNNQFGFTAIEISLVIVIVLILLASVGFGIKTMMGRSENTEEVQNINQFNVAIRALGLSTGGYPQHIANHLYLNQALPHAIRVKEKGMFLPIEGSNAIEMRNTWNGLVKIHNFDSGLVALVYEGVPEAACRTIVKNIKDNDTFVSMQVSSGNVVSSGSDAPENFCDGSKNKIAFGINGNLAGSGWNQRK